MIPPLWTGKSQVGDLFIFIGEIKTTTGETVLSCGLV